MKMRKHQIIETIKIQILQFRVKIFQHNQPWISSLPISIHSQISQLSKPFPSQRLLKIILLTRKERTWKLKKVSCSFKKTFSRLISIYFKKEILICSKLFSWVYFHQILLFYFSDSTTLSLNLESTNTSDNIPTPSKVKFEQRHTEN